VASGGGRCCACCAHVQLLRVIGLLQLAAKFPVATPADWKQVNVANQPLMDSSQLAATATGMGPGSQPASRQCPRLSLSRPLCSHCDSCHPPPQPLQHVATPCTM